MGYKKVKTILDVPIALVLVVILSPLFILIGIALLFANKGKVMFLHERSGFKNRSFKLYKFRTMRGVMNSGESDAERVTTVGRLLRRTSMDELPQLLNVISGSMSIVGPRPLLPEYDELLNENHKTRFDVKPGITGLSQLSAGERLSWRKRFDLDAYYVQHQSFLLDFKILLRTFKAILVRANRNQESFSKFKGYDQ